MVYAIVGAVLVFAGLADVFVTVLNYDGFAFISSRAYRWSWSASRRLADLLPARAARWVLSMAAPAMMPGTVAIWVGLEIVGFALVYRAGLGHGWFELAQGIPRTVTTALYFSGVTVSTLGYGDITPATPGAQFLTVVEARIGFGILTLTISYVLATFRVLERLHTMSDTLRRVMPDSAHPTTVIGELLAAGDPAPLRQFLERVHDDLQAYDEGLRLHPITYYFHTREVDRSAPYMFSVLGDLISALRFGVPREHRVHTDAWLRALDREYEALRNRIERSFLPRALPPADEPLSRAAFDRLAVEREQDDAWVSRFLETEAELAVALGTVFDEADDDDRYERYVEFVAFASRHAAFLDLLAEDLGYARDIAPRRSLLNVAPRHGEPAPALASRGDTEEDA